MASGFSFPLFFSKKKKIHKPTHVAYTRSFIQSSYLDKSYIYIKPTTW